GMADILMYLRVPEPSMTNCKLQIANCRLKSRHTLRNLQFAIRNLQSTVLAPFRRPGYRRLILGMGLWSFSANLVLPFVPVFQRGEVLAQHRLGLGVSWLFLAVLYVATSLAAMATSRWWAGWSRRFGARSLLLFGSGHLFVTALYFVAVPGRCGVLLVFVAVLTGAFTAARP